MSLPLVVLSGEEVAFALLRRGFVLRARDDRHIVVEKGFRRVEIPALDAIAPEALLALVREAGVSYAELVDALDPVHEVRATKKYDSHVRPRAGSEPVPDVRARGGVRGK